MIDPNAPAYPSLGEGFGNPRYHTPGLTIRAAFVKAAMQGLLSNHLFLSDMAGAASEQGKSAWDGIAAAAITAADAQIAALNAEKKP